MNHPLGSTIDTNPRQRVFAFWGEPGDENPGFEPSHATRGETATPQALTPQG